MTSSVEEQLVECFALVFPELAPGEIRRASSASLASWDSVAAINLVTVIEEVLGLQIEAEELGEVMSFATILDLVQRKLR